MLKTFVWPQVFSVIGTFLKELCRIVSKPEKISRRWGKNESRFQVVGTCNKSLDRRDGYNQRRNPLLLFFWVTDAMLQMLRDDTNEGGPRYSLVNVLHLTLTRGLD